MTTRRGKIARLPLAIRQELNTRLRNGEEGKTDLFEGPGADALNEQRRRLREEMAARKAAQQPVAIEPNGA
jgi:hypothetical protein